MVINNHQRIYSFSIKEKWSFDVDLPKTIRFSCSEIFPVFFIPFIGTSIPSMFLQNVIHCLATQLHRLPISSSYSGQKMMDIPRWTSKIKRDPIGTPIK